MAMTGAQMCFMIVTYAVVIVGVASLRTVFVVTPASPAIRAAHDRQVGGLGRAK
jgi:hypothetical protein